MSDVSRRNFLGRTAVAGGAVLALPVLGEGAAAADTAARVQALGAVTVTPSDPRYRNLVSGSNQRWVGKPDYVRVASSSDHVLRAVQEAVDKGLRVVVRSGGHCDEDFTASADVKVVIDVSLLNQVGYDETRKAFSVEPGAVLGSVYKTLYKGWGVTLPGGTCPTVGAGGHIVGGGYGALSRLHGLTVDHLQGVEVVVVDANGKARKVVATRDANDPNRDLWWAHTGAGGGNFGIITKYWLRTPGTANAQPTEQLPKPPAEVIVSDIAWSWADLTEEKFSRIVRNFVGWHERNSAPDSPNLGLFSQLKTQHRVAGMFRMSTQIDASIPNAAQKLDEFLAAVNAGTGLTYSVNDRSRSPWFNTVVEWFGFVEAAISRWKVKSAYVRKAMPDDQIAAIYRQLTRTDYENPYAMVALVGFGGKINTVASGASAVAQRDSIVKMMYVTLWTDQSADAVHDKWIRECYQDVYAATGGVPKTGGVNDGAYINYADSDLANPALNSSGTPWHELYFKDGYAKLQQVKNKWDPKNVFTHSLAIRPR